MKLQSINEKYNLYDSGDILLVLIAVDILFLMSMLIVPHAVPAVEQALGFYQERNDEKLIFSEAQIDKMNKDFKTDLEVGWCFDRSGQYITNLRKGDLKNQSRGSVVVQCGSAYGEIHTHPIYYETDKQILRFYGSPEMSEQDKESFRSERSKYGRQVKCVYIGYQYFDEKPLTLNCWDLTPSGEFERYNLYVDNLT